MLFPVPAWYLFLRDKRKRRRSAVIPRDLARLFPPPYPFSFSFFSIAEEGESATLLNEATALREWCTLFFPSSKIAFCHFPFSLSLRGSRFLLLHTVSSSSRRFLSSDQERLLLLQPRWWFRGWRLAYPSQGRVIHSAISLLSHSGIRKDYYAVVLRSTKWKIISFPQKFIGQARNLIDQAGILCWGIVARYLIGSCHRSRKWFPDYVK